MTAILTSKVHSQTNGQSAWHVASVVARLLGCIFILSGIGKIPLWMSFVETISLLTKSSATISTILAILVVVFEIGGGIALFKRYRLPLVSILFSLFLGVLILVLVYALVQQKNFLCHCFGIFDIGLSQFGEIVLDVILLNTFVLLILLSVKRQSRVGFTGVVLFLIVAWGEFSVVSPLQRFSNKPAETDVVMTTSFVEQYIPEFALLNKQKRVIFLLNYADFSCPPCFDSFAALADSLELLMSGHDRYRIAGVFREDETIRAVGQQRLMHWKEVNGFDFPVVVAPDSLFQRMNNGKSAALVSEENNVLFFARFPLSRQEFKTILSIMK